MIRLKRLAVTAAFGMTFMGMSVGSISAEAKGTKDSFGVQYVTDDLAATTTDADEESEKRELSGWIYNQSYGGYAYYKDNSPVRGWNIINGRKYFFDTNGIIMEGFQTIGSTLYYLGDFDADAALAEEVEDNDSGFVHMGTCYYYIYDDLKVATGRVYIEGTEYIFDDEGAMLTGWQEIKGVSYYLGSTPEDGGVNKNCYQDNYWLGADGSCDNKTTGDWYRNSTGWWFENNKEWYPFSQWLKVDGTWYYFDENGYMVRATWKEIDGSYYYFNFDGSLQEKAETQKGEPTGQWIDGYYVDHSGAWTGSTAYWYWDGYGYQLWSSDDSWQAVNTVEIIDNEYISFDGQGYAYAGGQRLTTVPPMGGAPSESKNKVIQYASSCLGFPYVYGGQTMDGTDCSGFTMLSYQSEGYSLPHNAGAQYATFAGNEVWISEAQPGDLLFYYSGDVENDYGTGIGHVALYIGNGETLEAGDTTSGNRWCADKAAYVTK